MANPLSAGLKTAAKELYLQGVPVSQIADTLELKRPTVQKWSIRENWAELKAAVAAVVQKVVSPKVIALHAQGDKAKQLLADELDVALQTFAKAPPLTVHELLDNEGRKARIDGLKALADIGVIAHGWGKNDLAGLTGNQLRGFDTEVIDVDEVKAQEPDTEQPKQVLDVSPVSDGDSSNVQ